MKPSFLLDPSKWPHRERLSRICAVCIVLVFLYLKLNSFAEFPGTLESLSRFYEKLNRYYGSGVFSEGQIRLIWISRMAVWSFETGILLIYIAAYLLRTQAVSVAKGFMEVVFPFIISVIPILISFAPSNFPSFVPYDSEYHLVFFFGAAGLMIIGAAVNLIGLLTLKKAFAIMSEARQLTTAGIFKFIRHPLYSGHFILFLGSLALRIHFYTILLYIGFIIGQIIRARKEEEKLAAVFPEYEQYKKTTPMFVPYKLIRH